MIQENQLFLVYLLSLTYYYFDKKSTNSGQILLELLGQIAQELSYSSKGQCLQWQEGTLRALGHGFESNRPDRVSEIGIYQKDFHLIIKRTYRY